MPIRPYRPELPTVNLNARSPTDTREVSAQEAVRAWVPSVVLIQKSEVWQALGGLHDRGFGGTRSPAEFVASALVMDDQIRQLISRACSV